MHKFVKFIVAALLLQVTVAKAAPDAPDPATEAVFKKLMTATIAADYDGFIADCDATMKAALTKTKLEEVSKQLAPRLKPGYNTAYLGALKQRGFEVHLWKVHCEDGGDDFLATLSIKGEKVGGFYLH